MKHIVILEPKFLQFSPKKKKKIFTYYKFVIKKFWTIWLENRLYDLRKNNINQIEKLISIL